MAGVKTLVFVLTGALLGIAIASLVVPPALSWYSTPGGLPQGAQIQALVQIPEVIRYSTGRLIRGQRLARHRRDRSVSGGIFLVALPSGRYELARRRIDRGEDFSSAFAPQHRRIGDAWRWRRPSRS
jgi:hypothetical protein